MNDATENYRRAIDLNPQYKQSYYKLGNTLLGTGDVDSAIENYRHAIAIDLQYFSAYFKLGVSFENSAI